MIQKRDTSQEDKDVTVILLSDGKPDPSSGSYAVGSEVVAFANLGEMVTTLANTIKAPTNELVKHDRPEVKFPTFWNDISGRWQRHDVSTEYLVKDVASNDVYIGAYGANARVVTIGYMMEDSGYIEQLSNLSTDKTLDFVEVGANAQDSTSGVLAKKIIDGFLTAGGREAVLRDEVSKYYYVPDGVDIPGVRIEGTKETGQTIVWEIGNIWSYAKADEPTITVPLVLREEYRDVEKTTYYPTNADKPEPSLDTADRGPDEGDTGAKLYYKDPTGEDRVYTIGTPKLPVQPKKETPEKPEEPKKPEEPVIPETPEEPVKPGDPFTQLPAKDAQKELLVIGMPSTGDTSLTGGLVGSLIISGLALVIITLRKKNSKQ